MTAWSLNWRWTCIARKLIYNPWMFLTLQWWMQTNLMRAGRLQTVNRNMLRPSYYSYTLNTGSYNYFIMQGLLLNKHWRGKNRQLQTIISTANTSPRTHRWIVASVRTSISAATQQVRGKGGSVGGGGLQGVRTPWHPQHRCSTY